MPAVAIVAIVVAAGAAAYSGYASSQASRNATRAQSQAAANALAYEREREAARKAEYDTAMGKYRTRVAAWQRRRDQLLGHYGVTVTNPVAPKSTPASSGAPTQGVNTSGNPPATPGAPPSANPATMPPSMAASAPPTFGSDGLPVDPGADPYQPSMYQTAQGFGIPQQGSTLGDMLRARPGFNAGQGV